MDVPLRHVLLLPATLLDSPLPFSHAFSNPSLLLGYLAARADRLLWSSSLPGIGLGSLASDRQVSSMTKTPVGANLDQSLDVERHFAAQIPFDLEASVDELAQAIDLLLGQIPNSSVTVDVGLRQDLLRGGQSDPEDVGERDFNALLARDVDTSNSCHWSAYPCRCLCFGLVQMTITVPWRRITLQLSQRALMEALTFNGSSVVEAARQPGRNWLSQPVRDSAARQVVRGEFDPNTVPRQNSNEVHPKLPGNVGQHPMSVLKFNSEHGVRERLKNRTLYFDRVSLGHGRGCVPFSRRVPARRADTRTCSISETGLVGQPRFRRS